MYLRVNLSKKYVIITMGSIGYARAGETRNNNGGILCGWCGWDPPAHIVYTGPSNTHATLAKQ